MDESFHFSLSRFSLPYSTQIFLASCQEQDEHLHLTSRMCLWYLEFVFLPDNYPTDMRKCNSTTGTCFRLCNCILSTVTSHCYLYTNEYVQSGRTGHCMALETISQTSRLF